MTVPDLGIRPDMIDRPHEPVGPKVFRWAIFVAILIPAIWSATGLNIDWPTINPFRWIGDWSLNFSMNPYYLIVVAITSCWCCGFRTGWIWAAMPLRSSWRCRSSTSGTPIGSSSTSGTSSIASPHRI